MAPLIGTVEARRIFGRQVAVDGVTLGIGPGETVALVGESGSGKSTLGRMLLGLDKPDAGSVTYRGTALGRMDRAAVGNVPAGGAGGVPGLRCRAEPPAHHPR